MVRGSRDRGGDPGRGDSGPVVHARYRDPPNRLVSPPWVKALPRSFAARSRFPDKTAEVWSMNAVTPVRKRLSPWRRHSSLFLFFGLAVTGCLPTSCPIAGTQTHKSIIPQGGLDFGDSSGWGLQMGYRSLPPGATVGPDIGVLYRSVDNGSLFGAWAGIYAPFTQSGDIELGGLAGAEWRRFSYSYDDNYEIPTGEFGGGSAAFQDFGGEGQNALAVRLGFAATLNRPEQPVESQRTGHLQRQRGGSGVRQPREPRRRTELRAGRWRRELAGSLPRRPTEHQGRRCNAAAPRFVSQVEVPLIPSAREPCLCCVFVGGAWSRLSAPRLRLWRPVVRPKQPAREVSP